MNQEPNARIRDDMARAFRARNSYLAQGLIAALLLASRWRRMAPYLDRNEWRGPGWLVLAGNARWHRGRRLLPLTLVGQMILFETLFALLYAFAWEARWPTLLETLAFAFVVVRVLSCIAAHRRPAGDTAASPA